MKTSIREHAHTMIGNLRTQGDCWNVFKKDSDKLRAFISSIDSDSKLGWGDLEKKMYLLEMQFSGWWVTSGEISYELTHDIAAMFAMTSAPQLDWNRVPHEAFAIKVPRPMFPLSGLNLSGDTWILVAHQGALVVSDHDTTASVFCAFREKTEPSELEEVGLPQEVVLCRRFVSNTIAYVTEHRENVKPKGFSRKQCSTFCVRPPSGVVISREFRDAAIATVSSSSLVSIRRALAHFVRGHWRNQAVGENRSSRRLTWVRPHRRGDESIGSVVSRIERITGARR